MRRVCEPRQYTLITIDNAAHIIVIAHAHEDDIGARRSFCWRSGSGHIMRTVFAGPLLGPGGSSVICRHLVTSSGQVASSATAPHSGWDSLTTNAIVHPSCLPAAHLRDNPGAKRWASTTFTRSSQV